MAKSPTNDDKSSIENDINNVLLLEEIENRPGLYDRNQAEFGNSNWRRAQWQDVAKKVFCSDWPDFSIEQKNKAVDFIQKRCRHLRAGFSRELRLKNETKTASGSNRKKYRYFDNLLFLLPTLPHKDSTSNIIEEYVMINQDEDTQELSPEKEKKLKLESKECITYEEDLPEINCQENGDANSTSTANSPTPEDAPCYENYINNELLIEEIERRPGLYDKSQFESTDVNWRRAQWQEVAKKVFSSDWPDFSLEQKNKSVDFLQRRWINLRSGFSRELRLKNATKTANGKKRRKYRYFDNMLFLLPTLQHKDSTSNMIEEFVMMNQAEDTQPLLPAPVKIKKLKSEVKECNIPYEEDIPEIKSQGNGDVNLTSTANPHTPVDPLLPLVTPNPHGLDPDTHFALALVPTLQAIPMSSKLDVQIDILNVLKKYSKH